MGYMGSRMFSLKAIVKKRSQVNKIMQKNWRKMRTCASKTQISMVQVCKNRISGEIFLSEPDIEKRSIYPRSTYKSEQNEV
jgi:hypothetical protein